MLAVFLTIMGHLAYGTTNVLWKNPRNDLGTLPLIIIRSFACMIIFGTGYFILTGLKVIPTPDFTWLDIVQTMGICAVNYFGLYFYLKSMKYTQVSNTIGFGKIGLIIGIAIGYFVYNEELSALKIILSIAVLAGVWLIDSAARQQSAIISKGLIFTILSKIFWASAYFYVPFINKLGPMLFCVVLEITVCALSCLLYLSKPTKVDLKNISRRTKYELGLLIILGTTGTFCLNFALGSISIILFAIIGLIEPVIGLGISKIYHKESLTRMQQAGIALGIIAAFVLSATK
ncbi:MAG: DMT family transporter [Flavobacteriia bacterium]|nr:DMT family transporter [Flavobacteriia bacterium]MBH2024778.1 DMT family transporter [Flavobacteriales bacterium]